MPAYTNFDSSKPDGGSGTGTTFAADTLAQMRALRDSVITGRPPPGWEMSRAQGAGPDLARPQYIYFMNNTLSIGFRQETTWTGYNPTTVAWTWSSGADYNSTPASATWTTMGTAQVNTFDGSQNVTAAANSAGWSAMFFEVWAKCVKVVADLAAHIAATGTAVHGLGSMATQAASAVAITGGSINNTPIGGSTRAAGSFTRVCEDLDSLTPAANAAVNIDWSKGATFLTTNAGSGAGGHVLSYINVPSGLAGHVLYITNPSKVTYPGATSFGQDAVPAGTTTIEVNLRTVNGGVSVQASVGWEQ